MNILDLINYDPETGKLTWARDFMAGVHARKAGQAVTMRPDTHGHLTFRALGNVYKATNTIWAKYYGSDVPAGYIIDHKNGKRDDNRICNLRLATVNQNMHNCSIRKDSTTGVKGVSFNKQIGKYIARVIVNNKRHYLGTFSSINEAESAAIAFRNEHHKEFANHG